MPAKGRAVYVATENFLADVDGVPQTFRRGVTRVREGHPILKGREHYFRLADESVHYEVEAATAAPGEKRGAKAAD